MKSVVSGLMAVLLGLSMSGCLALGGPKTVMSAYGPEQQSRPGRGRPAGDAGEALNGFVAPFLAAERAARPTNGLSAPGTALTMRQTGLALVRANCDDYFRQTSHTQRASNVSRQLVAATSAIASTFLLSDEGNESLVQYLGLGTSASYALIDVYTENFLFSAANISSVRALVMAELDHHRLIVEGQDVNERGRIAYMEAAQAIRDHEAICLPQSIASLVRTAINTQALERSPPGTGISDLNRRGAELSLLRENQADQEILRELNSTMGGPNNAMLNNDQAGSLFWLIAGPTNEPAKNRLINAHLSVFTSGPFQAGEYNPGWQAATRVTFLLSGLSQRRRDAYASQASVYAAQLSRGEEIRAISFTGPTIDNVQ